MNPDAKKAIGTTASMISNVLVGGPIGLVAIFVKEMFTGIFAAEKAKAAFKRAMKEQSAGIAELFKQEQAEQQQYESSFLQEYEVQLQKEQKVQTIKAGGLSIAMIFVVLLLLWVMSKIF